MTRIETAHVGQAIEALDACEQLLELLRGPLNGGMEYFIDDLIESVQDRIIVAARYRLAGALKPSPAHVRSRHD